MSELAVLAVVAVVVVRAHNCQTFINAMINAMINVMILDQMDELVYSV
jgi:hypothetical protein